MPTTSRRLPALLDAARDTLFLAQMEQLLPWPDLTAAAAQALEQTSTRTLLGVQHSPAAQLRMYFLQCWFGLTDQALADRLLCVPLYRRFARIEGVLLPLPDALDIRRFRTRVERTALGTDLLQRIQPLVPHQPRLAAVQAPADAALLAWACAQEQVWQGAAGA